MFRWSKTNVKEALVVDEVTALMRYAAESGRDPDGTTLSAVNDAVNTYQAASDEEKPAKRGEVLKHYSKLATLTSPVNGRTLLDTEESNSFFFRLIGGALFLLVVAIFNGVVTLWFANQPEPEEGLPRKLFELQRYFLEYLSPFIWGAIGTCTYLAKKLYDIAQDRYFDRAKLNGVWLRVLLGSILGAVVYHIYDRGQLSEGGVNLHADAIAFFTGLGVKVVYGAFERTVEVMAQKLNLGAVRKAQTQPAELRTYLNQELTKTDKAKDKEKHRVLTELISQLEPKAGE